jgi:hypothetical protein
LVGGMFFWLAGVGGEGQQRAANDGGGNVQQMTPRTSGSIGERQDGQRVAAVDDDGGSSSGGRGGEIVLILW